MKVAEDFKKAAKERNISFWLIHNCSLCGYPCGYHFRDNEVYYDSGCDCTDSSTWSDRTWDDVADHYNMQKNEKYIKEMDQFWGFTKGDDK